MRGWMMLGLLVVSTLAHAGGVGAVRKQVEMSLLVKGEISVDATGKVADFSIDRPDELPPGVVTFVQAQVPAWTFEPMEVEGKAVAVRNRMRMLAVAKKDDAGGYEIRLQAVSFHPLKEDAGFEVVSDKMDPPRYPAALARAGASGTVFLLLKIGRDGTVKNAFAEQVNLRSLGTANVMTRMRESFAESAVSAARQWTFTPPRQGPLASAEYWTVRTNVDYLLDLNTFQYGKWVAYVPGPRQTADWVDQELVRKSPEALAGGETQLLADGGLRLLTPVGGDS
ncbi:energy transducer TonB [Pseudoxanthomonas sp.]|uniref:energy transducer TonB n=1 Tax=Pseudoxanthomonas sp. TaxID=1871049 RepID=UPI002FDF7309